MPIHRIPSMPLSDFFKIRTRFEQAARDRIPERLDHSALDISHGEQVIEEMLMELLQRVEAVELENYKLRELLGQE